MAIADAAEIVRNLATVESGTVGIRKAFEYAPQGLVTPLPAFVNFIDDGDVVFPRMMGQRETEMRIRAVALVALQADSADAERQARALVWNFIDRLDQHKTLDDATSVLEAGVSHWEYGPVNLQTHEQPYLGVSFTVNVRTIETPIVYRSTGS